MFNRQLEKRISTIEQQLNDRKEERDLFMSTWRTVVKRFADDFHIDVSDLKVLNGKEPKYEDNHRCHSGRNCCTHHRT